MIKAHRLIAIKSFTVILLLFIISFCTDRLCAQVPGAAMVQKPDSALTSLKNTLGSKATSGAKTLTAGLDTLLPGNIAQQQLDAVKQQGKQLFQQIGGNQKLFDKSNFLKVSKISAEADYTYLHDTTGESTGVLRTIEGTYGYNLNVAAVINNLPFTMAIRGSNGIYTANTTPLSSLNKFNFDHTAYMESIKSKVLQKVNPATIAAATMSRIDQIKSKYEQSLGNELNSIQTDYSKTYQKNLELPADINNVSMTDAASLKAKLLPASEIEQYKKSVEQVQTLSAGKTADQLKNDSAYLQAQGGVKRYEALQSVYSKVTGAAQKFQNNPVVKELKGHLPVNSSDLKGYLSNPANLQKVVSDNFSMSSLQQIFTKVTTLNIGQNALPNGQFSYQDVVNSGLNTEIQSPKMDFGLTVGKNNSVNNWLQNGLSSGVTNEYSSLTGFKFGSGTSGAVNSSVMMNTFNFKNSNDQLSNNITNSQSSFAPVAPYKNAVMSIHSGFAIDSKNAVTVDLSKSFGAFNNSISSDSTQSKQSSLGSLMSGAGSDNYAASLDYKGQLFNTDVTAFAKHSGLGYNNPGDYLLRRGETQAGLGFSKRFLKNKLTVKYNGNYRLQKFDTDGNYTYGTLSNKAQFSYKLDKTNKIGFTYQRSDYHANLLDQPVTNGNNMRLQLDGYYKIKWKKKTILNSTSLSRLQMNLPMLDSTFGLSNTPYNNNSTQFTHSSSLILKQNILTVSILANRSDNTSYYFNTSMFNSEASYSYLIGTQTHLTSGLGYYVNYGWNTQVGITQQISTTIINKLSINVQVGCRKAIQVIRPELADQLFVNSGIKYSF